MACSVRAAQHIGGRRAWSPAGSRALRRSKPATGAAGQPGHDSRLQQSLRVDDEIVAAYPAATGEARRLAPCAAAEQGFSPAPDGHACGWSRSPDAARRCRRMPPPRTSRRRCPERLRQRILDGRKAVDDVTHRRRLDDQHLHACGRHCQQPCRPPPATVATASVFRQLRWPSGQTLLVAGRAGRGPARRVRGCSASGGVLCGEVEP